MGITYKQMNNVGFKQLPVACFQTSSYLRRLSLSVLSFNYSKLTTIGNKGVNKVSVSHYYHYYY